MTRSKLKFEKFQKALVALEVIYQKLMQADRSNVDATIQRFEFTFELAWKYLKDMFYEKGIVVHYPKEVLQQAFQGGVIDDEALWLAMLRDRNMTSHTYDEKLADVIYGRIQTYVPALRALCDAMEGA